MSTNDDRGDAEPTDDDIIESMITGRGPRQRKMPNIDRLPDAIVDGAFTLSVGDELVIERWYTSQSRSHWMGTNTYFIRSIHENGDLVLTDFANSQAAMANWRTAVTRGWRFKDGRPKKKQGVKGPPTT